MRAEDKERPAILPLLPALEAMPCAYQRRLSCVFPSMHRGPRLIPPGPSIFLSPPPRSNKIVAVASRTQTTA